MATPQVALLPDNQWVMASFPFWRFDSPPPAQSSDIDRGICRTWREGGAWRGQAAAYRITNIPPVIPNVGILGTSLNVSTAILDGVAGNQSLADVMRLMFEADGHQVLAVCVWERRDERFGPDLLGYEMVVFTKELPGQGQLIGPAGQQLAGDEFVQPFALVIGGVAISAIGLAIIAFTAFVVLDQVVQALTGQNLGIIDAFAGAIGSVSKSIGDAGGEIVGAPFSGAATILVAGTALAIALSLFFQNTGLSATPGATALRSGQQVARGVVTGPGDVARSVTAAGRAVPRGRGRSRS